MRYVAAYLLAVLGGNENPSRRIYSERSESVLKRFVSNNTRLKIQTECVTLLHTY